MADYAVKWTPIDKGVPGWLCDYSGAIILFPTAKLFPEAVLEQTKRNLQGDVWGVFMYRDNYPLDSPYELLMCPDEAMFYA